MNLAKDLLFLHGHITDPRSFDTPPPPTGQASLGSATQGALPADAGPRTVAAARQAGPAAACAAALDRLAPALRRLAAPARFFDGLLPLAALSPLGSRSVSGQPAFGQTYGNRVASRQVFGGPAPTSRAPACMLGICG